MFKALPLQPLDRALDRWRALPYVRPREGWLREIRNGLGVTTRQLARMVGVSQAAVVDAERNEDNGNITLATLRRYAEALDCELYYALVPRRSLQATVEQQAERAARDAVTGAHRSMSPEDQSASQEHVEQEVAALRARLMAGRRSRLWR